MSRWDRLDTIKFHMHFEKKTRIKNNKNKFQKLESHHIRTRNKKWEDKKKIEKILTLGTSSSFLMNAPGPATGSLREVLPIGPSHDTCVSTDKHVRFRDWLNVFSI